MSRLKKFTISLASGYLQTAVNICYTLASVPLAFHYLTAKEFALWQVALSVSSYLLLVDFGMTDSTARILMDHKDDPAGGAYGSVVKMGVAVFLIQGLMIAGVGVLVSFWIPELANLSAQFVDQKELARASRELFYLTAGQCLLQGIFFPARIFSNLAMAHQRYDFSNYSQAAGLVCNFGALWIALHQGFGVYSILLAGAVAQSVIAFMGFFFSWKAGFFPSGGCWGRFDRTLFKEIFSFGGNMFLMSLGSQLVNASQVLIISNTLSLEAAAVWAVATKTFTLAQQLVGRILTFSCSPLCEMIVRGEHERFLHRFRDLIVFSSSAAVFVGGGIAFCNQSFLDVWLKGREILAAIHTDWSVWNDSLLAIWLLVTTSTVIHVTAVGFLKRVGRMRYVYFCEGVLFITVAVLLAPHLGISGIILSAIIANTLCSGVFGVRRTILQFRVPFREVVWGWMAGPFKFLLLFAAVLIGFKLVIDFLPLNPLLRLVVKALAAMSAGIWLGWKVALPKEIRKEAGVFLQRIRTRYNFPYGLRQKPN